MSAPIQGSVMFLNSTKIDLTIFNSTINCNDVTTPGFIDEQIPLLEDGTATLGATFYLNASSISTVKNTQNTFAGCMVCGNSGAVFYLNSYISMVDTGTIYYLNGALEGGIYYCNGCNITIDGSFMDVIIS